MNKEYEMIETDEKGIYEIYEVNEDYCYFYGTEYECLEWIKKHTR